MNKIFLLVTAITFYIVKVLAGFTTYESLSCCLMVFYFLNFVHNLGHKLVILDILILITILTCLLMPVAGYHHFSNRHILSSIWGNYMRVHSDEYYSFMFPATVMMIIGLKLPIFFRKRTFKDHEQYMTNVKAYVGTMKYQGLIMVAVGFLASLFERSVPGALTYVFFLLRYLMFVGAFYCLYSDLPNKKIILVGVFGLLIFRSIYAGMFGELLYMGAMTVILVLLGSKFKFITKLATIFGGIFLILVIQSIKPTYRGQVWRGKAEGQQVSLFASMVTQKATDPLSMLKDEKTLFLFYGRFNQGQIISRVLESVPARFPYAEGQTIYLSLAASVVPRFMWPDKPESGGIYNFKRFLGVTLRSYSIGLSPFGEAWGNFGRGGGIVFMFFFGLLFNFFFHLLLSIATRVHSLILWFPFLFFYAIQIESDIVTMVNSFTKAAIFSYFMYKIFPYITKMKI
ncbi:MAG TPA: hypothetical protein VFZ47_06915 [Chitinophagaceae bacterium]